MGPTHEWDDFDGRIQAAFRRARAMHDPSSSDSGGGQGQDPAQDPLLDEEILGELLALDQGGDGSFLRQIVDVFVKQADDLLVELAQVVDGGNAEQAASLAHKLKGSARTVGAARLGRHCEGLEHSARTGDVSDGVARVAGIKSAYAEARDALLARTQ